MVYTLKYWYQIKTIFYNDLQIYTNEYYWHLLAIKRYTSRFSIYI